MEIISVGDEFDSFQCLKFKVEEIERISNCTFVTENSLTVENANKVVKEGQKLYEARFKYRFVKLSCKYAGSVRTATKGHGKSRPNPA